MKRSTATTLLLSVLALTLFSCTKKEISETTTAPVLPATPYVYATGTQTKTVSLAWTEGHMVLKSAEANPVTNDGAKLGRVLFHDNTLSGKSCNGCHNGNTSTKGSRDFFMPKSNGSIASTAGQAIHPAIGMEDAGTLTAKIASTLYYRQLFQEAYGTPQITTERVSDALAQYMTAMSGASATDPRFADPFK